MRNFLMSLVVLLSSSMLAGSPTMHDGDEELIIQRYDIFKKSHIVKEFKDSLLNSSSDYLYDDVERILKTDAFNSLDIQSALIETARDLDINPEWLIFVIYKESRGITDITNNLSGATGIIQWLPSTAECLGYDTSTIRKMSFKDQLVLVKAYFKASGKLHKINSYEDLYLCVFYPKAVGQRNNYVIGRKNSYVVRQNRSIDENKNGIITVKEFKSYANII